MHTIVITLIYFHLLLEKVENDKSLIIQIAAYLFGTFTHFYNDDTVSDENIYRDSYELVLWDADLGMPLSFTQDIFSKAILMNIIVGTAEIVGTAWISVLSMLYYPTLQSPLHAKAKTKVYRACRRFPAYVGNFISDSRGIRRMYT